MVAIGDETRFRQVLEQLLENESKYAPTAEGVSIGVWRVGDEIQVYVTDDGPGVPVEDWESVFEPFVRIEGRGRSRGSGIGLFAARRLMDAMGGRVWLEPNGYAGAGSSWRCPRAALRRPGASGSWACAAPDPGPWPRAVLLGDPAAERHRPSAAIPSRYGVTGAVAERRGESWAMAGRERRSVVAIVTSRRRFGHGVLDRRAPGGERDRAAAEVEDRRTDWAGATGGSSVRATSSAYLKRSSPPNSSSYAPAQLGRGEGDGRAARHRPGRGPRRIR